MGLKVHSEDEEEINPWLACGADCNIEEAITFLESTPKPSPNAQDENGYSLLHAASSYSNLPIIRMLISKYGADPNLRDFDGDTPLHECEDAQCAEALIELGADPTIRNLEGILPIQIADHNGFYDVVEVLEVFTPSFTKLPESDDEPDMDEFEAMEDENGGTIDIRELASQYGIDLTFKDESDEEENNVEM